MLKMKNRLIVVLVAMLVSASATQACTRTYGLKTQTASGSLKTCACGETKTSSCSMSSTDIAKYILSAGASWGPFGLDASAASETISTSACESEETCTDTGSAGPVSCGKVYDNWDNCAGGTLKTYTGIYCD